MSTASYHRWADIPPEQLNPMLTRQYITGEQSMIARIVIDKGCVVPTHQHPNEQIAYILEGALEFTLEDGTPGGTKQIVSTGEVLVIPANLPHSAIALEDTVDIDLFAPPRHDWINNTDTYLR